MFYSSFLVGGAAVPGHEEAYAEYMKAAVFSSDLLKARVEALEVRNKHLEWCCSKQNEEVCQILGKALDYPWFKDDQKNFPGATEVNGVCVGEHVAETIAESAASTIVALSSRLEAAEKILSNLVRRCDSGFEKSCKDIVEDAKEHLKRVGS